MKISILVPVYNSAKYLHQALDSLAGQTWKDLEFICINDGSTDNSLEILSQYAAKDKRFKVFSQPNGGYGKSLNHALRHAQGEYIGILDPDDWAEKDMYALLAQAAIRSGADVVKGDFYNYCGQTGKDTPVQCIPAKLAEKVFSPKEEPEVFLLNYSIWSAIYKKKFLQKYQISVHETPGASYQDVSFMFFVWSCASSVFLLRRPLLHYRTDNSGSSVHSPSKVWCICEEYEHIENFLRRHPEKAQFEGVKNQLKYRNYMWNVRRLRGKIRKEFICRTAEQFRSALEKEKIYWQGLNKKHQKRFKQWAYHPRWLSFKFSCRFWE